MNNQLFRIWYKKKDTHPIMPSAVVAKTQKEKRELIQKIESDGRFEVIVVTEEKRKK